MAASSKIYYCGPYSYGGPEPLNS